MIKYPFKLTNMLLKKENSLFCVKDVRPEMVNPGITLKAPKQLLKNTDA